MANTLHLLPSTGHQTAATLKQNALVLFDEAQSLRRALQSLDMSWQGGGQEQFVAQAKALLRNLETQADALQFLAGRLEREVTEWEQTDQRGASSFRGSISQAVFYARLGLPFTGGTSDIPFLGQTILPMFTAISTIPFLTGLPVWLNSFLDKFFPPPTIVSPIPEGTVPETPAVASPFGKLLEEVPPATPSAQAAPPPSPVPAYEVSYNIPPLSQGALYGSAACLPTTMSMALDYYHSQNSANTTASPSDLIGMLDQGDGTLGNGIGLDKLNDDLGELGYTSTVSAGNMNGLESALQSGPVIVNSQVGLTSNPRDITLNGSTNHAILVKAINAESVVINDPWSGTEKTLPRADFEKIWNSGGNYMVIVQPQAVQ
ncbi:MAG: C39 family peptidase [Chloroflexota bacterium]